MARDVVIEGRFGERLRLRVRSGTGVARAEAEGAAAELVSSPIGEQALRGLVFAAGAVDASRRGREGLRRLLVELLVQGRIALEREAPARESGQRGRAEAGRVDDERDAPLVDVDWIGIELVDADGAAVAWESYIVELRDGRLVRGKLGPDGKAVVRGIPSGACRISFPRRGARLWGAAGQ